MNAGRTGRGRPGERMRTSNTGLLEWRPGAVFPLRPPPGPVAADRARCDDVSACDPAPSAATPQTREHVLARPRHVLVRDLGANARENPCVVSPPYRGRGCHLPYRHGTAACPKPQTAMSLPLPCAADTTTSTTPPSLARLRTFFYLEISIKHVFFTSILFCTMS